MSPYLFILNTHCGVTFSLSQSFEWTGSQSAFDVAAKNTSSSAILDTDRLLFVNSAESAHRTLWRHLSERHASPCRRPAELFFPFFFGRSSNSKHKAMVAHNCHGKTENLTAKTKYLTAKPKTSRQKQKPHGKNKSTSRQSHKPNAKPNTSQQKQNSLGFAVGICFPNIRKRIRR